MVKTSEKEELMKAGMSFLPLPHIQQVSNSMVDDDLVAPIGQRHTDERAILWVLEGWCEIQIHSNIVRVSKGEMLLFNPDVSLWLRAGAKLSGYRISYSAGSIADLLVLQDVNPSLTQSLFTESELIKITGTLQLELIQVMDLILRQHFSKQPIAGQILRQYHRLLFLHIYTCLSHTETFKPTCRGETLTDIFLKAVEENFRTKKLVTDYAAVVSVSSKHLNDVIKKTTGYSAGYHIRQRIALEAKREATTTGSSMKKIAYELGFHDLAHFSKFFKNTTGFKFSSLYRGI